MRHKFLSVLTALGLAAALFAAAGCGQAPHKENTTAPSPAVSDSEERGSESGSISAASTETGADSKDPAAEGTDQSASDGTESAVESPTPTPLSEEMLLLTGDWELVYAVIDGQRMSRDTAGLFMLISLKEDGTYEMESRGGEEEGTGTGTWGSSEDGIIITDEKTGTSTALIYDEAKDHLFIALSEDDNSEGKVFVRAGSEEAENAAKGIFDLGGVDENDPSTISYTIEEKDMISTDEISVKSQNHVLFSPRDGAEISFTVTNGTGHSIAVTVRDDSSYINGFQVPCSTVDWSSNLKAGETKTVNFHFDGKIIQLLGITEIGTIDLSMCAVNRDDFTAGSINGEMQSFSTGLPGECEAFKDAPLVFEGKGVRIYYAGPNTVDEFEGYTYTDMFLVENTSETEKSVMPWETLMNGQSISMVSLTHVMPGKKALARPLVDANVLKDAGITEITSIETAFHISDSEGGESGLTDPVTVMGEGAAANTDGADNADSAGSSAPEEAATGADSAES